MARRSMAGGGMLLAAMLLSACVPEPTPSPTGFADEAAAFAAAEATYRAYVDALNRVDLSDPATFEDVYRWTTGEALATEKKSLSGMHADRWQVDGDSVVTLVRGERFDARSGAGEIIACVDVSRVTLVDAEGHSQVAADRPRVQTVRVDFEQSTDSASGALITSLLGSAGDNTCG